MLSALVRAALSLFTPKVSPDHISLPAVRRLVVEDSIRRGFED